MLKHTGEERSSCCVLSSELFPGVWILCADISEISVCSIFTGNHLPMKMEKNRVLQNVGTQNSDAGE